MNERIQNMSQARMDELPVIREVKHNLSDSNSLIIEKKWGWKKKYFIL